MMEMKTKIVERLLKEKHITVEETVILLEEKQQIGFRQFPDIPPAREVALVPYHTICGCDVCHCVMGNNMVYPNGSGNYVTDNTFTTSLNKDENK